jgi:hypothetical protein
MRAGVIGFKALSGGHSGRNFGRYTIGLLHRVVNSGQWPVQQALKGSSESHMSDQ